MGQAEDAKTQALKVGVPSAVALEGGSVAVVAEPVGLDDQAAVAPDEVDLVWPGAGIHLGHWKAVAPAERQEESLQLAAGEVVAFEIAGADQAEVEGSADGTAEN